jgi:major inositol transporter-like SP family MFS transporter
LATPFGSIRYTSSADLVEINSIMYYGQRVLIESGFGEGAAVIANIAPGVVAVVGGVIALYNMD